MSFKIFLIFVHAATAAATKWSTWLPSNDTSNCFLRNILTCSQGQGINCADTSINTTYEMVALNACDWNCTLNQDLWIQTEVRILIQ